MPKSSNTSRLIVIEGLDGSGKATQAGLLAESLTAAGTPMRRISFPDYAHKSSIPVQMYLNGEIGSLEEVNVYAASTFYSIDRYISYQTDWSRDCKEGRLILADRYTTSNACHQMVKLPQKEWNGYLDWLADLEYTRMGLPEPGLVIYLDMDPNTSRRLLEKRYGGDESRKDLHEANLFYLLSCRGAALYAAEHWGWKVIRCCDGSDPYPPEQIHQAVLAEVDAWLRRQHPAESDGF